MAKGRSLVVMIQLDDVTDRRLSQDVLDRIGEDPVIAAAVRAAIVANLRKLGRVIAVMSVEKAMLMTFAVGEADAAMGARPLRPHPDYVPPGDADD